MRLLFFFCCFVFVFFVFLFFVFLLFFLFFFVFFVFFWFFVFFVFLFFLLCFFLKNKTLFHERLYRPHGTKSNRNPKKLTIHKKLTIRMLRRAL